MHRKNRPRPRLLVPERLEGVALRAPAGQHARRPPIDPELWKAAVGARIAEKAQPMELDRGVLLVKVATSAWASELSLLAGPLAERLRAAGVDVESLRCRVGALDPARQAPLRVTRAVPRPLPLPPELSATLGAVGDDDLRGAIAEAARANLAWQAHGEEKVTHGGSRAARVPGSAERGSDRPARTSGAGREGAPRKP